MSDMDVDKPAPTAGQYTEHINPQGRKYWYDTINQTSHWEKPAALQSPFERAMASTPWKAYTSNGRNYWVHAETKKSVWELPEELVKLKAEHDADSDVEMKEPKSAFPPPAPALTAAVASSTLPVLATAAATPPTGPKALLSQSGVSAAISPSHVVPVGAGLPQTPHGHGLPDGPVSTSGHSLAVVPHATTGDSHLAHSSPGGGPPRSSPQPLPHELPFSGPPPQHQPRDGGGWRDGPRDRYVIPDKGWQTLEQAEEAFEYLLQKSNVEANWTWDVAMRAIITDPLYKSLHTLAEKKAVFNRYTANLKASQAQERAARIDRLRPQFHKLLDGHPQVYSYSTFRTMSREFAGNSIWESAKEDERSALWEEFVGELKNKEANEQRDLRTRNLAVLKSILDTLSISPQTRWIAFLSALQQHPTYAADPLLAELDPVEIIDMYEDRLAFAEKALEVERAKERLAAKRSGRHAREAFKALLEQHVEAGTLTWRSKWRACLPLWRETPEYRALLGKPGSSPLDLFHDVVDDLTIGLETKAKGVVDLLGADGFKVTFETKREEFDAAIGKTNYQGDDKDREELWALMHGRLVAKAAEEKRRRERHRQYAIDDLRYAMRKVEPPLSLDASYGEIEQALSKLKEFKAVENVDDRKAAWDKFVQRQREKLRERDETPSSSSRDQRSYGRERDYTSRSSGGGERERHSSRELNYSERASGSRSRTAGGVYDDDRERSSRRESDATRTSTRKERERDQPIDEREAKRVKGEPSTADLEEGEI